MHALLTPSPEALFDTHFGRPTTDRIGLLHRAGLENLDRWRPLLLAADPQRRVSERSAHLCAALGVLATSAYRALGGTQDAPEVESLAAALSLLTKIDDQIIDAPDFHQGWHGEALQAKVARYLEPTLASLQTGRAQSAAPRCALAAQLGRGLAQLAAPGRLRPLLSLIEEGWAIQARAVAVLTADPETVTRADVERVTAQISGAWLMMITMVGTLPSDAQRSLTEDEREAFWGWGGWIQRADALADLDKDLADGHRSSAPLWLLAQCTQIEPNAVYAQVAEHGVDLRCIPNPSALTALQSNLQGLGEVGAWLQWIHGFLLERYLAHPRCARARLQEVPCSAR